MQANNKLMALGTLKQFSPINLHPLIQNKTQNK